MNTTIWMVVHDRDESTYIDAAYRANDRDLPEVIIETAIAQCKKLNGEYGVRGLHYVLGFREGQSEADAEILYPTQEDIDAAPPPCSYCRKYLGDEHITLVLNDNLNKDFTMMVHPGKCAEKELSEPGVIVAPPGWVTPPPRPKNPCRCGKAIRWDTHDGGHWMHVSKKITDHEAVPEAQPPIDEARVVNGSIDDLNPEEWYVKPDPKKHLR